MSYDIRKQVNVICEQLAIDTGGKPRNYHEIVLK